MSLQLLFKRKACYLMSLSAAYIHARRVMSNVYLCSLYPKAKPSIKCISQQPPSKHAEFYLMSIYAPPSGLCLCSLYPKAKSYIWRLSQQPVSKHEAFYLASVSAVSIQKQGVLCSNCLRSLYPKPRSSI